MCFSPSLARSGPPTIFKLKNDICPFGDITENKPTDKLLSYTTVHGVEEFRQSFNVATVGVGGILKICQKVE